MRIQAILTGRRSELFHVFILVTILSAINLNTNSFAQPLDPKETVTRYEKAMYEAHDYEKAYSYITKNFAKGLSQDQWAAKMQRLIEYAGLEVIESKFLSMSVDGDMATVQILSYVKTVAGYGQSVDVYLLVKENGVWKIDEAKALENVL